MKKPNLEIIKKIRRYCTEIDNALQGVTFQQFNSSEQMYRDKRSACSLYLFQIGELAHKLTDNFKKEYSGYNWSGAYRLRNIIGHDYEVISNDALWKASQQNRAKLLGYTAQIISEAEQEATMSDPLPSNDKRKPEDKTENNHEIPPNQDRQGEN